MDNLRVATTICSGSFDFIACTRPIVSCQISIKVYHTYHIHNYLLCHSYINLNTHLLIVLLSDTFDFISNISNLCSVTCQLKRYFGILRDIKLIRIDRLNCSHKKTPPTMYRPPKVRPKNLTMGGRYFYG